MHKYLMIDRGILTGFLMRNAQMEVNRLKKDTVYGTMFTEGIYEQPAKRWEMRLDNGYPNVIYDPLYRLYRCYYTVFTLDEGSAGVPLEERRDRAYHVVGTRIASLCYAESTDGVNWVKPDLGLTEFEGNKDNNILFRYAHGTGVMLDEEEKDRGKRYKLVTKVDYSQTHNYMATAFSEDGIHFTPLKEWPENNPMADCHNFTFKDIRTGKYKLITRTWQNGVRICAICESSDFLNWSKPEEILRGDGFEDQVYSMPVFVSNGLTLGLASIYHEGDTEADNYDTVDVELKFSTDGMHWDSVGKHQPVIARGNGCYPDGAFDCGCIYTAAPVLVDGQLWVYYMGGNGKHTNFRETCLARAHMEEDRLAGYVCKRKEEEARILTAHFSLYGDSLSVLADLEPEGYLSVALGNKNGTVYEGFEAENCVAEKQEDGYYKISYRNRKITELDNRPVSLHIMFRYAKLYAVKGELECQKLKY